ncbi:hypothetical protein MBEHAL_0532 [Halarchaeum acidiphilum MH1-52-1]|uniref:DUF2071 domain-containing protein n=1 Tax=Halarchaeum acidiphilum MH1-52-1 TaxID=1261545 RepID=U2YSQ9_9EURY|nr:DUF2071 domain-containing protein [Halarchaeum acidiphilum]GAD51772.1 hypothetical protein MBEHAL_0532 [Halarchaeum acidiphilum MH1-52-1]
MHVLSMDWRDVCFASWPVEPAAVARTLPDGLAVDTYEGDAYLSVVPFVMGDVRPPGWPRALAPTFGELNLRTYVTAESGDRAIYFYNLDASGAIGIPLARTFFRIPYYHADIDVSRVSDSGLHFRSTRTHEGVPSCEFDATITPGAERVTPESGSLESFLVERYRFYTRGLGGLWYGDIEHDPWTLTDATLDVRRNDLFDANGFDDPDSTPHVAHSRGVEVDAHHLRRL